jgi:hypothetical protein
MYIANSNRSNHYALLDTAPVAEYLHTMWNQTHVLGQYKMQLVLRSRPGDHCSENMPEW